MYILINSKINNTIITIYLYFCGWTNFLIFLNYKEHMVYFKNIKLIYEIVTILADMTTPLSQLRGLNISFFQIKLSTFM